MQQEFQLALVKSIVAATAEIVTDKLVKLLVLEPVVFLEWVVFFAEGLVLFLDLRVLFFQHRHARAQFFELLQQRFIRHAGSDGSVGVLYNQVYSKNELSQRIWPPPRSQPPCEDSSLNRQKPPTVSPRYHQKKLERGKSARAFLKTGPSCEWNEGRKASRRWQHNPSDCSTAGKNDGPTRKTICVDEFKDVEALFGHDCGKRMPA